MARVLEGTAGGGVKGRGWWGRVGKQVWQGEEGMTSGGGGGGCLQEQGRGAPPWAGRGGQRLE